MSNWKKAKATERRIPSSFILAKLALLITGAPDVARAARQRGAEVRVTLISPGTILGELIGVSADRGVIRVGARGRTMDIKDFDTVGVVRESLKPLTLVVGMVAGRFIGFALIFAETLSSPAGDHLSPNLRPTARQRLTVGLPSPIVALILGIL